MMPIVVAALVALTLPDNFDPEVNLIQDRVREGKAMHQSRQSAGFVKNLLANGTPEDIALAVKVLDAIISCQDVEEDSPDKGNYRWYYEDEKVTDRNAAAFILSGLLPALIDHGDRLPKDSQERVRASIRLALEAVSKINVTVGYTNIAVKDFVNTTLGGEYLNDNTFKERGRARLLEWLALTDSNGIPAEFNSPTYYRVTVRSLRSFIEYVQDDELRIMGKTAMARLALTQAIHIHPTTRRMAGPHSRAYHPTVVGEDDPEIKSVDAWIKEGTFPAWARDAIDYQPAVLDVEETAHTGYNLGIYTHMTPSFALGVSSREFFGQSNVLISHYQRPDQERHGVIYTRYLTNDKWLGSFYHSSDRSTDRNLIDEGTFWGVQKGSRAIGLYSPRPPRGRGEPEKVTSAKGNVIWTGRSLVDEIWVGQKKVDTLPVKIAKGDVVVVVSGDMMSAVLPLTQTDLGGGEIRLSDKDGDLVLEMFNYVGEEMNPREFVKRNKGNLQCGFYFEMADRVTYKNGAVFSKVVASGKIKDVTATPADSADAERLWAVEYMRDGKTLGIEIDIAKWELKRRWTQDGDMGWPMHESQMARQNRDGRVEVGGAVLTCNKEAAWVFAPPQTGRYVAAYHGQTPSPVTLTVPNGKVEIESMGMGTIVWDNGKVTIEAIQLKGIPKIVGGQLNKM